MSDYKTVQTSAEVWAVIKARHPELTVFSTYSAPDGDQFGDPSTAVMFTSFGFDGHDYPIIEAKTTWDIDPKNQYSRLNLQHQYWLCSAIKNDD